MFLRIRSRFRLSRRTFCGPTSIKESDASLRQLTSCIPSKWSDTLRSLICLRVHVSLYSSLIPALASACAFSCLSLDEVQPCQVKWAHFTLIHLLLIITRHAFIPALASASSSRTFPGPTSIKESDASLHQPVEAPWRNQRRYVPAISAAVNTAVTAGGRAKEIDPSY